MELESTGFFSARLSEKDFQRLSAFIHSEVGIKMPPAKRNMLESRLRKRLRHLDIKTYNEYTEYLFSSDGMRDELVQFINVITTNKTDFFREPVHFDFLKEEGLYDLIEQTGAGRDTPLLVWSSACSMGHEPYTLAIVLSEFARVNVNFEFRFEILATDISTRALDISIKAVYDEEQIEPVPLDLKRKYFLASRDRTKKLVRIIPSLRKKVQFRRLNLMNKEYPLRGLMDIIFCRNVIIYFDLNTRKELLTRLCKNLKPGGYLFMGHSEVLDCRHYPLTTIAPTIYRKVF